MSELVVETQKLVKRYGGPGRNAVAAVDGLNMHVERGSIYGFLGRNGAGKTTTIRLLSGLVSPMGGSVRVLGLDPARDLTGILERTGFVIDRVMMPYMTGKELVRFNRGFYPRWSDEMATRYADVLEIAMDRPFKRLSQGNKTKLCLLLALAQRPELLVLDEPTAGLDPVVTDQLLRVLVEDFANDGRTILMSSHHLSEVEKIADWVGIIDKGKLLLEARLDDIRSNYRRVRAVGQGLPRTAREIVTVTATDDVCDYVLCRNAVEFTGRLRSNGAAILEISPMNLSEVFLVLAGKETHVPVEVLA